LGLIALYVGYHTDDKAVMITGGLTLLVKAFIIPYILKFLSTKFSIQRNIVPSIKIHYLVMIVPIVLVFTYYLITPISSNFVHSNYVALSVSALFLSLLLIIEHKNIAAKIVGFLSIENTLFLLGISTTNGMPMLLELGIFVDLLMLIVIINLLFKYQGE
jgi:hydrogenase-4 component E